VSGKEERKDAAGEEAKVSPPTGADTEATPTQPVEPQPAGTGSAATEPAELAADQVESPADPAAAQESPPTDAKAEEDPAQPSVVVRDRRKVRDPAKATTDGGKPTESKEEATEADAVVTPFAAELEAMRRNVDELTRDLQRITAEYANYRKRVDRDRGLVGEQATGNVLVSLLPVLDDIDRAREHGDLVGPFGSVAEQLVNALTKFGLTPFGEKGDKFDPTRHEAVAHQTSAEVDEPTCVDILRRGYLLGERLLRPALVAVADPE
jgi:molecular chaperone GrpE